MPRDESLGAMCAHAMLATAHLPDQRRTVVTDLHSEAPLLLRLTNPKGPAPWGAGVSRPAWVCIAAGAAGPVGGDELSLEVTVGPDSALVLSDVSATLLLPGPDSAPSRTRTTVRVGQGGTFVWLPEPVIAARGSHHTNDITIELAASARMLSRETLLLGRHAEEPGTIHQRLRVSYAGRPLHHQDLDLGTQAPHWRSPAVLGGNRAVGSVLVVDAARDRRQWPDARAGDQLAYLPLNGPGFVVTALADDALTLQHHLDAALTLLTATP